MFSRAPQRPGREVARAIRPLAWGLGLTLPTLGFVLALAATPYQGPSLPLISLLIVVFVAHSWGFLAGMGSALATWLISIWYYSHGGHLLTFAAEDQVRLAALGVTTPAAALMVGLFKRQADRQEALLSSQAELLELAHEAIIVYSLDGSIRFWNDGAEELFGWPRSEALGQVAHVLRETRFPVAREAIMDEIMDKGRWAGEIGHARRGGLRIVVESRQALQLARNGKPLAILEVCRDITARRTAEDAARDAEERFRALADASFEGIAVSDQGTILLVNGALARLFGYAQTLMVGMHATELLAPESRPFVAARGEEHPYEVTAMRGDGSFFPAEIQVKGAVYEGTSVQFLALRDITWRKEVERLKDEVFGLVGHDLRNPIVAIRMALDAAVSGLMGEVPEKVRTILAGALGVSGRMLRLTEDLLEAEQMAAGLIIVSKEAFRADTLFRKAVAEVEAGGRVVIEPTEVAFVADGDRIVQVLVNLIGNAIKFSPERSPITLSATVSGDAAILSVQDSGKGIPEDRLDVIFERFQQLETDYGNRREGFGLGLAICRTIVGRHGGRIWAESKVGQGSAFRFTLPLGAVSEASAQFGVSHLDRGEQFFLTERLGEIDGGFSEGDLGPL